MQNKNYVADFLNIPSEEGVYAFVDENGKVLSELAYYKPHTPDFNLCDHIGPYEGIGYGISGLKIKECSDDENKANFASTFLIKAFSVPKPRYPHWLAAYDKMVDIYKLVGSSSPRLCIDDDMRLKQDSWEKVNREN